MAAFSDYRRRNLFVLGGVTLLVVALAGVALTQRSQQMGPSFEPQPVIPGLTDTINNIGEVTVETRDTLFHARRTDEGTWVIPERSNFPANVQMVRAASVGMSELQALEPRTAQPELLGRLGLVAPADGGDAVRVVLSDRAGETLGDLLIGHPQGVSDPEGLNRFYVRRNGEDQSWLARGSMVASPDITAWLDKNIVAIDRERIRSTTFTLPGEPSFTVARADETEMEYTLTDIPPGREMSYPGVAYVPATVIANFTFDDALPVNEVDFTNAAEIVTETFDGLRIIVHVAPVGDAHWASLAAESDGAQEQQDEAAQINISAHAWAFLLPEFTAQTFLSTRESLLAPPAE